MTRNKQKQFHKYFSNLLDWKMNHKFDQHRKKSDSDLFIINLFRCVAHEKLMVKKNKNQE